MLPSLFTAKKKIKMNKEISLEKQKYLTIIPVVLYLRLGTFGSLFIVNAYCECCATFADGN